MDSLVIPNVDERVVAAMAGACPAEQVEAVGVVETFSLASAISVADISVKAADVDLIEVRLGRGMGGKSYVIITGEVAAVEASVRAAEAGRRAGGPDRLQRGDSLSPYGHDSRADVRLLLGAGT